MEILIPIQMFQLTAARRRLDEFHDFFPLKKIVSTHSRPKAAGRVDVAHDFFNGVSTHSRPKAAGHKIPLVLHFSRRFNSQPPEGGWDTGNWKKAVPEDVSTHSRPKAAGLHTLTR